MPELKKYYGLVIYRARKIHAALPPGSQETLALEELVQIGYQRLVEIEPTFEPERGIQFATFASPRIDYAIKDYLRELDPLTIRERQRVKAFEKAEAELSQLLGREPSIEEIARFLELPVGTVRQTAALRIAVVPIDDLGSRDRSMGTQPPTDLLSPEAGPEQQVMRHHLSKDVETCLQTAISDLERQVITFRFTGEFTLQAIGSLLDLSISAVQRTEVAAKRKLRPCLEAKGWAVTDI